MKDLKSAEDVLFTSRSGKVVSYDADSDRLLVEMAEGGLAIVIDLSSDQVTICSRGDMTLDSGGKLRLKAREGVEVDTGGDLRLESESETIVRGKLVRIN